MKKNKIFLAVILFITFTFLSCGVRVIRRKRRIKDVSLARVLVKRKLVVAIHDFFPPYVTYGTGNVLTGFDIDIAREVAKEMNIEIEFKPMSWEKMNDALQAHEVDCLWSAMSVNDFENIPYLFSDNYMASALTVMVTSNSSYKSVNEISHRPIGFLSFASTVSAASTISNLMKTFANLQIYSDFSLALSDLKQGKIQGLVLDIFSISKLIENGEDVKMLDEPLARLFYVVVFGMGEESLKSRINESLIRLEFSGKLSEISRKWFGVDVLIIGK